MFGQYKAIFILCLNFCTLNINSLSLPDKQLTINHLVIRSSVGRRLISRRPEIKLITISTRQTH
jgi:hypothetical protein